MTFTGASSEPDDDVTSFEFVVDIDDAPTSDATVEVLPERRRGRRARRFPRATSLHFTAF